MTENLENAIDVIAARLWVAENGPEIDVELVGDDGNGAYIIGKVSKALKRARAPRDVVKLFQHEASSGDYDNLLVTCMRYVNVI